MGLNIEYVGFDSIDFIFRIIRVIKRTINFLYINKILTTLLNHREINRSIKKRQINFNPRVYIKIYYWNESKAILFFLFWKFSFELINRLFRLDSSKRRIYQISIGNTRPLVKSSRATTCILVSYTHSHTHTWLLTIIRTLNSTKIYPFTDWIHTVNRKRISTPSPVAEQRKLNVIMRQTRISFYK